MVQHKKTNNNNKKKEKKEKLEEEKNLTISVSNEDFACRQLTIKLQQ